MTGTMRGAGVLLISGRSFAKGRPKGVYMSLLPLSVAEHGTDHFGDGAGTAESALHADFG